MKFAIIFTLKNANGGVLAARLDTYLTTVGFLYQEDGSYSAQDQGPEWQALVVSRFHQIVSDHNGKARLTDFRTSTNV